MTTPEEVAQYLQDHPQFFEENSDLVESLRFPHPYQGRAISINERQVEMLREKNRLLQRRLQELVDVGERNDVIGNKIHRLTVALLGFDSLTEMLHGLQYHLCEDFSIPYVALRLWQTDEPGGQVDLPSPEFDQTSNNIRILAQEMLHPYCGPEVDDEIRQWFEVDAEYLQSFAVIPLKQQSNLGLLVIASPEVERFFPDMGTLYLERLGDMVSSSITRLMQQTPGATPRESTS
ncbi:DUF484 family protein [Nitrosomonas sp. HPC101]|uniref:DUF484 family protein n=1 Tax=Nitrosomonas sp. HPC101 TaxID=1658667 RepID=UPI001370E3AE|nr:DUF484 family protein [Nitrosomonas sp. HPC101]MXS84950.1 DUF484 family protein [Nitrosomonas sp. HPC101]